MKKNIFLFVCFFFFSNCPGVHASGPHFNDTTQKPVIVNANGDVTIDGALYVDNAIFLADGTSISAASDLGDLSTDDLDDVAERGSVTDKSLTVGGLTATGDITANNLSGTNTGDQDLSGYWKSDGSLTAIGDWDLGSKKFQTSGLSSFKNISVSEGIILDSQLPSGKKGSLFFDGNDGDNYSRFRFHFGETTSDYPAIFIQKQDVVGVNDVLFLAYGKSTTSNYIQESYNGNNLIFQTRNPAGDGDIDFRTGSSGNSVTNSRLYIDASTGNIQIPEDNAKFLFGAGKDASIKYDGTNMIIDPKENGSGYLNLKGKLLAEDTIVVQKNQLSPTIIEVGNSFTGTTSNAGFELNAGSSYTSEWYLEGGTGHTYFTIPSEKAFVIRSGIVNAHNFYADGSVYFNTPKVIAGTGGLRVTVDGNIGIGEVSPQDKLEVNGTILVKDKLKFTQDDGNEFIDSLNDGYMDYGATTGHRFNNDVTIDGALYVDNAIYLPDGKAISAASDLGGASTDDLDAVADRGATTDTVLTTGGLITTGKVGIGTTTPRAELDVVGRVYITRSVSTAPIAIDFINTIGETMGTFFVAGSNGHFMTDAKAGDTGFRAMGGDFLIGAGPNVDTEPPTAMIITTGGNVGIGTTTPNEKLHVVGNIEIENNSNNCKIIIDADATCDTGTKIVEDNGIAACLSCS